MTEMEFLDYFSELRGMPREEQIAILESARYEAFVTQGLVGKAALLMVSTSVAAGLIIFIPLVFIYLVFGVESIFLNLLFLGIGMFVARRLHKAIYGRLLKRGVMSVLGKQS